MVNLSTLDWILLYIAICLWHFKGIISDGRKQKIPLKTWESKFLLQNIGLSLIWWIDYFIIYLLPLLKKLKEEFVKEREFKMPEQRIKRGKND